MTLDPWLGPDRDWSLAPVAAWLMTDGRMLGDPAELLAQLAAQLDRAGAQIDRLRLTSGTLHPQVLAWGVMWDRGAGARHWSGPHGVQFLGSYTGSPVQFVRDHGQPFRRRVTAVAEADEHAVIGDLRAEGMTDYVALPLVLSDASINVLAISTQAAAGFSEDDLLRLRALANLLTPLIEIIGAHRTALGLLDTFVGPRISRRILRGQVKRGDGDRIEAAFWYSDLRGFTALTESLPTDQLLGLLNDYFEHCAKAAAARGGEILQFIGDAILIVFEIHQDMPADRVCEAALDAAMEAFESIALVNQQRLAERLPTIEFGLGLHVGTVTHANVGAPDRLAFNVVGPAVNLTARLQSLTRETGVPLLVSGDFARRVQRPLRALGEFDLRGVSGSQRVFTLAGPLPSLSPAAIP